MAPESNPTLTTTTLVLLLARLYLPASGLVRCQLLGGKLVHLLAQIDCDLLNVINGQNLVTLGGNLGPQSGFVFAGQFLK
jgi:hypothetical protein